MAIFNLWGRQQEREYHLSESELSQLLKQLEQRGVRVSMSTPLRQVVANQFVVNQPEFKGVKLYFPHFVEHVFSVVDQAIHWLQSGSPLCSDAVRLLHPLRVIIARVACEEEGFLLDQEHPARQYMDLLLYSMMGSESLEKDHYLLAIKKQIFEINSLVSLGERERRSLLDWRAKEQRRVDLTTHRITTLIKSKLKMEKALEEAERAVGELLEIYQVPVTLKRVIHVWKRYLQVLYLDERMDRQAWLGYVNQLADILSLMNNCVYDGLESPIDLQRVAKQREMIREAIACINYPQEGREPLLKAFDDFYRQFEMKKSVSMVRVTLKERFQCDFDFDSGIMVPDEAAHVEHLAVDDWVELMMSPENRVRLQLIAKIPETASLIFLRRRDAAIVEKRYSDLALGIETKTIAKLDSGELLFTRALAAGIKAAGGVCRRVSAVAS